jgi:hypothetical protein
MLLVIFEVMMFMIFMMFVVVFVIFVVMVVLVVLLRVLLFRLICGEDWVVLLVLSIVLDKNLSVRKLLGDRLLLFRMASWLMCGQELLGSIQRLHLWSKRCRELRLASRETSTRLGSN